MITVKPRAARVFGVSLLRSPGGEEETILTVDRTAQKLTFDRTHSCASPNGVDVTVHSAPLSLADGETLHLHIFVDRSVIEVFANGHTALTTRVYPTRPDSLGLSIFTDDNPLTVNQIDVWQLDSIW